MRVALVTLFFAAVAGPATAKISAEVHVGLGGWLWNGPCALTLEIKSDGEPVDTVVWDDGRTVPGPVRIPVRLSGAGVKVVRATIDGSIRQNPPLYHDGQLVPATYASPPAWATRGAIVAVVSHRLSG